MVKNKRTHDSDPPSRPTPPELLAWVAEFPRFRDALALAQQRAQEEGWHFTPDAKWLLRQVLAAGLDHLLGQPILGRTLAPPEPEPLAVAR